jgi:hypothetical protein
MVQIENNSENLWFEMRNEEYDSDELTELEEEVEQMALFERRSEGVIKPFKRYIKPVFHFTFC